MNYLLPRNQHFVIVFLLLLMTLTSTMYGQEKATIQTITRNEFVQMDAAQKRLAILQWNNYSLSNEVPLIVEQQAMNYYKQQQLDMRIYHKYKVLFKTITNESLPLSNRINACYFILDNYEASVFPVEVAKTILDELILKSK